MKFVFVAVAVAFLVGDVGSMKVASDGFIEISRDKRQTTGPLDCGGTYTAPTGYFHTPGFPVAYLDNTNCTWHIRVSPPYVKIKLEFVPMISLHSYLSPEGIRYCYDYIKVHDGNSSDAPYDLWCGHGIAPPTVSSGSDIFVSFTSDYFATGHRGFMAVYAGLTADNTTECVDLEKMEEPVRLPGEEKEEDPDKKPADPEA